MCVVEDVHVKVDGEAESTAGTRGLPAVASSYPTQIVRQLGETEDI